MPWQLNATYEEVRDAEVRLMDRCNAWQRVVKERKEELGRAEDDLRPSTPLIEARALRMTR